MSRISRMSESVRGVRPNWRIYCSLIIGSYQPIVPIRGKQTLLKVEKKYFLKFVFFFNAYTLPVTLSFFFQNRGDQTGFTLFFLFLKKALFFRNFFSANSPPPTPIYRLCPLVQSCPYSSNYFCYLARLLAFFPTIVSILLSYLHSSQLLFLSYKVICIVPNYCFCLTKLLSFFSTIVFFSQ